MKQAEAFELLKGEAPKSGKAAKERLPVLQRSPEIAAALRRYQAAADAFRVAKTEVEAAGRELLSIVGGQDLVDVGE